MTTVNDWNFKKQNVEFTAFDAQEVVSAESTLIAAGRPLYESPTVGRTFDVYPIGLVENFGLTMGAQLQRIFEIGSRKSIIIPGRVMGSATIARIVYDSKSLLRVLYADYEVIQTDDHNITDHSLLSPSSLDPAYVDSMPGYDGFWVNLDTELFRNPMGIAVLFQNKKKEFLGGVYLENCFIGGSQLTINAGTDLLAEGVNFQFTEAIPVKVKRSTP